MGGFRTLQLALPSNGALKKARTVAGLIHAFEEGWEETPKLYRPHCATQQLLGLQVLELKGRTTKRS